MNEFMNQLVALRSKVGNLPSAAMDVARGTVRNMANVGERSQAMADAERKRNEDLIIQNFGSLENYNRIQQENPLPPTPGEYLGKGLRAAGNGIEDLFARILASRSR